MFCDDFPCLLHWVLIVYVSLLDFLGCLQCLLRGYVVLFGFLRVLVFLVVCDGLLLNDFCSLVCL